jgi:hypothetical protein
MTLSKSTLFVGGALLALLAVYGAQRGGTSGNQQVAQVGSSYPLPVYVVNEVSMPDDFVAGSQWQFTTWTVPNSMSWVAKVEKVEGGWALLNVQENQQSSTGWYYVPQMPGRWQKQ